MAKGIVENYASRNWKFVVWPQIGDIKGPKEQNWTQKTYTLDDYNEGNRVGLLTGQEVAPGQFLHDIDIDWAPGAHIAISVLPDTDFIFGRESKPISHLFYVTEAAIPTVKYADLDGTTLLEIRGIKADGGLGFQTMVPPSIWTKGDNREPLRFFNGGIADPGKTSIQELKEMATLAAIGMMFARKCSDGQFTHEVRLAWAAYMSAIGISREKATLIGQQIIRVTGNKDSHDIEMVVNSTYDRREKKEKVSAALLKTVLGMDVLRLFAKWIEKNSNYGWVTDKNGIPLKDRQDNIRLGLKKFGVVIEYDAFGSKAYISENDKEKTELTDAVTNNLYLRFDPEFKFLPNPQLYQRIINDIAYTNTKHPVVEYLNTLQWDGVSRINTWIIQYGGAEDNEFVRTISALPLIAAVRRVRMFDKGGCKFDEVLVLEGDQGAGKSTAVRRLCPNEEWFLDDFSVDLDSKEVMERTAGKWIVEISELGGRTRGEKEKIKAMLSRQEDTARMAYGREPVTRKRQFVFIGTVNDGQYLSDPTGGRRYWPVKINQFNFEGIGEVCHQLWAEANVREQRGENIQLRKELWPFATSEQEKRQIVDPWEDLIREFLMQCRDYRNGGLYVDPNSLMDAIGLEGHRRTKQDSARIAEIMRRLDFQSTIIREKGNPHPMRGYVRRGVQEGDKLWDEE